MATSENGSGQATGDSAADDQQSVFKDPTGTPGTFGAPSGGANLGDRLPTQTPKPKLPTKP
jgi:hypothetical protein